MVLFDVGWVQFFFFNWYDVEVYVYFKKLFLGDCFFVVFGCNEQIFIDVELIGGFWLIVDFLLMVDLGNIFFISEKLDSLMEGGLFVLVEDIIDQVVVVL